MASPPQHLGSEPCPFSAPWRTESAQSVAILSACFLQHVEKRKHRNGLVYLEFEYLKFISWSFPGLCLSFRWRSSEWPLHTGSFSFLCSYLGCQTFYRLRSNRKSGFRIFHILWLPRNSLCITEASSFPSVESGICPNVILHLSFQVAFMLQRFLRLERTSCS